MPLSKIDSDSLNSGAVTSAALGSALTFSGQQTIPTINLTGGQITFPATAVPSANANTLDDYEEGTFTPSFTGTNLTSLSLNSAQYTKIGRLVTLFVSINGTVTSSNTLTYVNMAAPFITGAATVGSAFLNNNIKSGTSQISGTSLYAFFSAASAPTAGAEVIQLSITYQV